MSEPTIVRRSLRDLKQGKTDMDSLVNKTDDEISTAIDADPDAAPLLESEWFESAELVRRNISKE